ncbi:MAG TPA: hypothetical protein DEP28_04960 [Bacteroidetes bacterium]|nr:hypothetical protein [Bacteroidota bacterium]
MKNVKFFLLISIYCLLYSNVIAQDFLEVKLSINDIKNQRENFNNVIENKISDVNGDFSGIYEGVLEISLCCLDYDRYYGKVIVDVTTNPLIFIFDGVNWNSKNTLKFLNNKIVYSDNENIILAYFENQDEDVIMKIKSEEYIDGNGFGYDHNTGKEIELEEYYSLRKTETIENAENIIKGYTEQEIKIKDFWINLKQAYISKDFDKIVDLSIIPLPIKPLNEDPDRKRKINSRKELLKFYMNFFDNEFLNFNEDGPHKYVENFGVEIMKGKYVLSSSKSYLILSEVNGEIKIIDLPGVWE